MSDGDLKIARELQDEYVAGWCAGIAFGFTAVLAGQPFDTVKTRMQAKKNYENLSMIRAAAKMLRNDGILSFYRGTTPMLFGSFLFRGIQWGAYKTVFEATESVEILKTEIPFSGGTKFRTLFAGLFGGSFRALVECPFEYVKVNRQIARQWRLRSLYTGLGETWGRSTAMFAVYITLVDVGKHKYPEVYAKPMIGPFIVSGVASTIGWWCAWPLERAKSAKQASSFIEGRSARNMNTVELLKAVVERDGFRGMYRGIGPGTARSFFANGVAMIMLEAVQKRMDIKEGIPG